MVTENNFHSGDWVMLVGKHEIEIYNVDYIKGNRYHITQLYSNLNYKASELRNIRYLPYLTNTPKQFNNDAEYSVKDFNHDGRLVSKKLIQLLYDEV